MDIVKTLSQELKLEPGRVERTIALLDEGGTVPFIARYRKERTGGLDEAQIREIVRRRRYWEEMEERRQTVLKSIREQGRLTPELEAAVNAASTKTELEDLYLPFRPKKATRASKAWDAGLEPLARWLVDLADPEADLEAEAAKYLSPENGYETADQALRGAADILAEEWAENAEARRIIRGLVFREGVLISAVRKEFEGRKTKFEMYHDHREVIAEPASHRLLAMFRGEREKVLDLELEYPRTAAVRELVFRFVRRPKSASAGLLLETVVDALDRLLAPSVETEVRNELREKSEAEAIQVFGVNLRDLLLAPPAGRRAVMGIDPGFRTGCKIAAVDGIGKFLGYRTIFPNAPKNDVDGAKQTFLEMLVRHKVELIAVGNGTASRETEAFVRASLEELPAARRPVVVIVSEAGASVYSASDLAKREFPKLDVTVRGAVSIARRLQDPLSELVKIEPRSIGVGQYQHDVDQAAIKASLDEVVESSVNLVGVDLNLASEELLRYVAGLNKGTAAAIVAHRNARGPFRSREGLKGVKGVGAKTFEQAAGFLRIPGAMNPLDNSAVHPERYGLVEAMAQALGVPVQGLVGRPDLVRSIEPERYVSEEAGLPTVEDILRELEKPGRDPRGEFRCAAFAENVRTMEDLKEGMILEGVVTNVTKFGAFVDLGIHQDGLVHISEIAGQFVSDPRQAVKVGQVVRVRVIRVDVELKRIGLSMKNLGLT
ncbi:MAG: RNA-binding transcriptional accessory protein [Candidatus Aminicenantes bacterium]|nr:RNA-binding transcriptional accessory protein [Candidatus Aminicenantes bacterium]